MVRLMKFKFLIIGLMWSVSLQLNAEYDHAPWNQLLVDHIVVLPGGNATQVNYDGMLSDRASLVTYLNGLSTVDRGEFDAWTSNERLAFLLNAYNAWTVELVLTEYPKLESIRDLGFLFLTPWKKKFIPLFGAEVSLDNIEHDMIRGSGLYNEPRIHFAANCAAIGCPGLQAEAYQGEKLEQQLEAGTRLFLSDSSRNYYSNGRMFVSSLFDWYEEDFEMGWRGTNSVTEFLMLYVDTLNLPPGVSQELREGELSIRHLKYDWDLNRTP
jgi:hypothetical protein